MSAWHTQMVPGDDAEIYAWIKQSGLQRLARIIAGLVNGTDERYAIGQPDLAAMTAMARIKEAEPTLKTITIARRVVAAGAARTSAMSRDQLAGLAASFDEHPPHAWAWLAEQPATERPRGSDTKASVAERRALGRLIDLMLDQRRIYDTLLEEAARLGPDRLARVQRLGRKQVEALLIARLKEQMGPAPRLPPGGAPPRNLFDLIKRDLE